VVIGVKANVVEVVVLAGRRGCIFAYRRLAVNLLFFCPRKIGTNWFMPAFVNNRFGESGMRLEDGTMVCCFDLKKSRNDCRICADVIIFETAESLVKKNCAGEPEVLREFL